MKYTHIFVKGDCWTPKRFWEYIPLTEKQAENFPRKDGYIREINDGDNEITKMFEEKNNVHRN